MNILGKIHNIKYSTLIIGVVIFAINIAYAIYNGVVGVKYLSFWYVSIAVYYVILSFLRCIVVLKDYTIHEKQFIGDKLCEYKLKLYCECGILLLILSLALLAAVILMVIEGMSFEYRGHLIFVTAGFAAYKIIKSIYNFTSHRHRYDYSIRALSNIGFAATLVALLSLQATLLAIFGRSGLSGLLNTVMGAAICVFTVGLGIYMIIYAACKISKIKTN